MKYTDAVLVWIGNRVIGVWNALTLGLQTAQEAWLAWPFLLGSRTTPTEQLMLAWTLLGIVLMIFGFNAGIIIAIFGSVLGLIIYFGWDEVKADPPMVAISTLFGHPLNRVIVPRIAFVLRLARFDGLIYIGTTQTEFDFKVKVRCAKDSMIDPVTLMPKTIPLLDDQQQQVKVGGVAKYVLKPWESGGEVELTFGCTFEPDTRRNRAYQLVTVGRQAGARAMLTNMISEALRKHATQFTWEELQTMMPELSAGIITMLTGVHPSVRVRTDDGTRNGRPLRDMRKDSPHRYLTYDESDPQRYLGADEVPSRAEIEYFLEDVVQNGMSDVRGLGIMLRRANAFDFALTGALAQAADLAAQEKQQRSGETIDFETEHQLAEKYITQAAAKGSTLDYVKALELVRINRRRATEIFYRGVDHNPLAPLYAGSPAPVTPPANSN